MRRLFFCILFSFLVICFSANSQNSTSKEISHLNLETIKSHFPKASVRISDKELIKQYEDELANDTAKYDKKFIHKLLNIIEKFNGKNLDTTKLLVGNIDGDKKIDTIYNRIYLLGDTVFVSSWWITNKDTIWKYKLANPYVYFNSELFAYNTRDIWATFAIGVLYGSPEIISFQEFNENADTTLHRFIYDYGISDLRKKGIQINIHEYKSYLANYNGNLLLYGDPELRNELMIWYRPAKRLILYYSP